MFTSRLCCSGRQGGAANGRAPLLLDEQAVRQELLAQAGDTATNGDAHRTLGAIQSRGPTTSGKGAEVNQAPRLEYFKMQVTGAPACSAASHSTA